MYERLWYYLKDTQFEREVDDMRKAWAARVQRRQWPRFRAADAAQFKLIDRNEPASASSKPVNSFTE